jgi:hypothetical protein
VLVNQLMESRSALMRRIESSMQEVHTERVSVPAPPAVGKRWASILGRKCGY